MVWKIKLLLLVSVLSLHASLFGQVAADETPFIEHEVLVMLSSDVQPDKVLTELAMEVNFEVLDVPSPSTKIYLLHVTGADWTESVGKFRTHRHVRAAQFNHLVSERETVPNDPNFGQQWHHVESGDHDIDSDLAWDVTTGGVAGNGARIVVAVLEGGGSNYSHTDLIDNHWTNPGEVPDNGIDDDNNGYVDDYNGWNVGNNSDNIAGGGHGTSVSGMIGATGNNGTGGVGVNWDVDIMQVDMANGLSESNVIAAYEYPKTMRDQFNSTGGLEGAFVVATNASWGIDQANPANYPAWCAYYDELGASGILNCGATANQSWNIDNVGDMPTGCSSDYMVSVTATNDNDVRTFSGYGVESIDLGAPGDQVYLPSGSSNYGNTSGTSFASPCVAGAIALVYSVPCPDLAELAIANPQGAADLVMGYIYDGVDVVPNLLTEVATGGRLNVANSVNLAIAGCGPVDCSIESFTATAECVYDMDADTVLTTAALDASFSNFLCTADAVCYKDSASEEWTCELTETLEGDLNNTSTLTLAGLIPNTSYDVFFSLDSVVSDTITFDTPDCGALVPGCTDSGALNYDETATIDNGGCEYPCTDVVLTITTDCWPEEVGWAIVSESGEELASVAAETYQTEEAEEVWEGCLVNGCHVLTITDEYGDGMFGSQWGSCDVDGNYVFTTADGAVIVAMGDPDYADAISHEFCLPVISGCTEAGACNYEELANANDGSCYSVGDACDDGDEETVLDAYTADCECSGVPAVLGCLDEAACNFDADANVDDASCFYVAQGTITGAQTATDMTTESYTYDGSSENNYSWAVSGGSIQGEFFGVGLLTVDVLWSSTGNGFITVTETDVDAGCTGDVTLEVDLLVNAVSELEMMGMVLFPNPVEDIITFSTHDALQETEWLELIDVRGQIVRTWPAMNVQMNLDVQDLAVGLYSLRIGMEDGNVVSAPVVIQR
ncbi:MAG: hypothetical protein CL828_00040 [Crocinitomicaceae bacterium]|nr:hypothetical protein [Crocinitomicaceae bacterium]